MSAKVLRHQTMSNFISIFFARFFSFHVRVMVSFVRQTITDKHIHTFLHVNWRRRIYLLPVTERTAKWRWILSVCLPSPNLRDLRIYWIWRISICLVGENVSLAPLLLRISCGAWLRMWAASMRTDGFGSVRCAYATHIPAWTNRICIITFFHYLFKFRVRTLFISVSTSLFAALSGRSIGFDIVFFFVDP